MASGVTSKPAIEGHFKTGQRTSTLDDLVLSYRPAVWQPILEPTDAACRTVFQSSPSCVGR
jgi:hypothetical protein